MQSLLAVCAMMIAALFSLSVHQSVLNARVTMVRVEVENQAATVGLDFLEYVGTKPFDAAAMAGPISSLADLTELSQAGGKTFELAQTIEDFHNLVPYVMKTFKDGNTLEFTLTSDVEYVYVDPVTGDQVPTNVPTFAKAVTVEITHELLHSPIRLTRVYTYP